LTRDSVARSGINREMSAMKSRTSSASWRACNVCSLQESRGTPATPQRFICPLPEVQDFLHARLQISAAHVKPYKKTIQESLSPDVIHGEDLDLARGRKAISDYKKATNDPIGTLDLMVYYVECGTQFAVEYGYGDEEFFRTLRCDVYPGGQDAPEQR